MATQPTGVLENIIDRLGAAELRITQLGQMLAAQPVPQQQQQQQFAQPQPQPQPQPVPQQQQQFAQPQQFAAQPQPVPQQQQFAQPQQPQQFAQPGVTADMISNLITPLVGDPNIKAAFQNEMAQMGIGGLPETQPHQYAELYGRFQQVVARFQQQQQMAPAAPMPAPAGII